MQVLEQGRSLLSSLDLIDGVLSKPIGGIADAPVVKTDMSARDSGMSFRSPSSTIVTFPSESHRKRNVYHV